jgi:CspA family cold shock protein
MKGTVKSFDTDKGYGFIVPHEGGKDIFVHVTAVQKAGLAYLFKGQRLSFETIPDKQGRGLQAIELQTI